MVWEEFWTLQRSLYIHHKTSAYQITELINKYLVTNKRPSQYLLEVREQQLLNFLSLRLRPIDQLYRQQEMQKPVLHTQITIIITNQSSECHELLYHEKAQDIILSSVLRGRGKSTISTYVYTNSRLKTYAKTSTVWWVLEKEHLSVVTKKIDF